MAEGPAAIPAGASHGGLLISESINPTAQTVFWITLLLALIVVVIVAADLVNRGRFRKTSLALTGMLAGLAPLLGSMQPPTAPSRYWLEIRSRWGSRPSPRSTA